MLPCTANELKNYSITKRLDEEHDKKKRDFRIQVLYHCSLPN